MAGAVEDRRLCLCSPHFPPVLSGVGDYTYFLAAALARIGWDVEVLTSVGEDDPVLYPLHPKVKVHRVIRNWGVAALPRMLGAVRSLRSKTLFLQYAPHAYDPRGITLGVNLLPALTRVATDKNVAVNCHELYIPLDRHPMRFMAGMWQRAMAMLVAVSSTRLTANSGEWPKKLRRMGLRKAVRVMAVGSNIPRAVTTSMEVEQIRSRFLGVGDGLLIGCFGSAGPHRSASLLRDALNRVDRRHVFRIVWLGKAGDVIGEDRSGITWTGSLSHPELSRIMSACDMFVLPFTDGVSTKRGTLAAALLHELPVITTSCQTTDSIFVHGDNVFLVPVGDSVALARGLEELAGSSHLRGRLARGARLLHDRYFAWDVIAQQVVDAIAN